MPASDGLTDEQKNSVLKSVLTESNQIGPFGSNGVVLRHEDDLEKLALVHLEWPPGELHSVIGPRVRLLLLLDLIEYRQCAAEIERQRQWGCHH